MATIGQEIAALTAQTQALLDAVNVGKVNLDTSEANAVAAWNNFKVKYLGAKSVDPTLDNEGNALIVGATYFNTIGNGMMVWNGTVWVAASASSVDSVMKAYNLSDLADIPTARQNLGLEVGVDVQAYDANIVSDASYVHTDNNYTTTEKNKLASAVTDTSPQALHATNALSLVGNVLYLNKADGTSEQEDLSIYLDDTNLSRIISGTYVIDEPLAGNKSLKFTRDDASVFYIDASMFFDDTNLVLSVDGLTGAVDLSSTYEPADATILKDADIGVSVQAYDATIVVDADIGVTVQGYDANTTKNNVSNVFTLPQRTTISAGANAINFTLSNDLDFTATAANITVGTMATKKGQQGTITIRSAENITGWGAEFLFAPDFSAVTPTPPATPTGTMEFWYKVVEVNGVDGGTANKIHIAWAK